MNFIFFSSRCAFDILRCPVRLTHVVRCFGFERHQKEETWIFETILDCLYHLYNCFCIVSYCRSPTSLSWQIRGWTFHFQRFRSYLLRLRSYGHLFTVFWNSGRSWKKEIRWVSSASIKCWKNLLQLSSLSMNFLTHHWFKN